MPDETYNDRALSEPSDDLLPKPQIEIIVDGTSVFKPGMKTYFVDDYGEEESLNAKVVGTYCSCDTVVTTHLICTCQHVPVCSCESHRTCACVGNAFGTTPNIGGGTICTCQAVSCGSPCACIPVYY